MLEFQVINVQRHVHETEALGEFWTFSRQSLVRTSGPVFTKVQPEFAKVIQRGLTKHVISCMESLITRSEHAGAKGFRDQKLDICFKLR